MNFVFIVGHNLFIKMNFWNLMNLIKYYSPRDVQYMICSFLQPNYIRILCESDIIENTCRRVGSIIQCIDCLNDDLQILIYSFLNNQPKYIRCLYECNMIQTICHHIGFIVQCPIIISNELVQWFHEKQIKINLQNHELIYDHWFHK